MADHDPLDPTPAPTGSRDPAAAPAPPASRDAHGFDPDDYDWIPVPRQRHRADGWSIGTQRAFIEALADTGSVADAARAVRMSVQSCYRLRRGAHAQGFARAWDAAIEQAGKALLDLAFERIVNGEEVPVFDREGQRIAVRRRYSDRLTMFLLRGYFPDRFGRGRSDDEEGRGRRTLVQPPADHPVEAALAALEPVRPAEPHRLMPPEELAAFIADEAANEAEAARFAAENPGIDDRVPAPNRSPVTADPERQGRIFSDYQYFVDAEAAAAEAAAQQPKRRRRASA